MHVVSCTCIRNLKKDQGIMAETVRERERGEREGEKERDNERDKERERNI